VLLDSVVCKGFIVEKIMSKVSKDAFALCYREIGRWYELTKDSQVPWKK